jgi:hypothetical protein
VVTDVSLGGLTRVVGWVLAMTVCELRRMGRGLQVSSFIVFCCFLVGVVLRIHSAPLLSLFLPSAKMHDRAIDRPCQNQV